MTNMNYVDKLDELSSKNKCFNNVSEMLKNGCSELINIDNERLKQICKYESDFYYMSLKNIN